MADVNAEADSPPGPSEGNAVHANNHGDVPPRGGRCLAVGNAWGHGFKLAEV